MAERVAARTSGRSWLNRPSPLELLVGPDVYPRTLSRFAILFCVGMCVAVSALMVVPGSDADGGRPGVVLVVAGIGVPLSMLAGATAARGRLWVWDLLAIGGPVLTTIAAVGMGPARQEGVAVMAAFASAVFLFVRPRTAIVTGVAMVVTYGSGMAISDGFGAPVSRAGFLFVALVPVGVINLVTLHRLERLARAERESSARLSAANATLQRFVSAPVAEAVLSSDEGGLLAPHRRQVAVVFADLRGFTRFSLGAEPEDVVDVLGEFYAAFGGAAKDLGATLGAFVGDGVMAFVGDPIPVDDPVARAVALGRGLGARMAPVKAAWRAKGYQLGHGVGIGYGYATLGVVGFEGRNDYTALGSVVNLASRLCGEAADGEIVLDARANLALGEPTSARQLDLKGYADPVEAFVL